MTQPVVRSDVGGTRRSTIGLAFVLLAQLMLVLDMTVVNVALPDIRGDLGFTPSGLSWILNAYTLTFGGLLLLGGRLGDAFGRRRTFQIGLGVFVLASLAGGLAPSPEILVAARAVQGVGAAIAAPNVLALLTTSARDDAERTRSLALFSAVSSAGASLGLILGGVLTGYATWRWSLFINIPIGIVVFTAVRRFVADTERRPARFDFAGAITATLGSASLVYGFISAPDYGWSSVRTVGALAFAVILLAVFVTVERRASAPLLPLALLRDRVRAGSVSVMALFAGSQFAFIFFTVQIMQALLGYGALRSGFAFLPLTLLIFATSRVAPRLVQRFGIRPLVLTGLALVAISNVWISRIDTSASYLTDLLGPMILIGIGAGLSFMPLTVGALTGVEPEHAGSASGMLQMGQQIGGALGLAVLVSVYGSHHVPGQVASGMPDAFLTATGLLVIGFVTAALLLRRRPVREPEPEAEEELVPTA